MKLDILRGLGHNIAGLVSRKPLLTGALAMFLILVLAYSFSVDIRASRGAKITGDEPFYLLTTQSLIQDRDLDLRHQYATESYKEFFDHPGGLWRQSVPLDDGTLLSPHNPGLSVLIIPGFWLAGLTGAQWQLLILAALTFSLAYLLCARLTGAHIVSWLATLAVALTASAFVYSTEIYPEMPAALALIVSLIIVSLGGKAGPWRAIFLALSLTAMVWMGVRYAPLSVLAGLYFLATAGPSGRIALVAAGSLAAGSFIWFHLDVFGTLTPYSVGTVYAGHSTLQVLDQHIAYGDRIYRLWGLFIDQRFGLARWAPVLLPAVLGMVLLLWHKGLPRLVVALVAAQILIATFVAITMMGWWFPGRTMVTVLPLFALPLVVLMKDKGIAPWLLTGVLALYSLAVTGSLGYAGQAGEITLAVDPFDMSTPLFAGLAPLFPKYTSWTAHTWALAATWLVVAGGAVALLLFRYRGWTLQDVRRLIKKGGGGSATLPDDPEGRSESLDSTAPAGLPGPEIGT